MSQVGRAVHQRGPQRLGGGRPAPVGAGHDRGPPVRVVPAGRALRRRRRGGRPLRPRHRLRRGVHEPRAAGLERPGRDGPVPEVVPRRHRRPAVDAVPGGPGPGRAVEDHAARTWTSTRSRATGAPRRPPTRATSPRRSIPVPIRDDEGTLTDQLLEHRRGHPHATPPWSASPRCRRPQSFEPDTAPDITAGNSSQMTDGAAAMLIAERSVAERLGLPDPGPVPRLRGGRRGRRHRAVGSGARSRASCSSARG